MKNSIVICCDGTWNSADQVTEKGEPCVTNVLKLAVRTAKQKTGGGLQIVYYDQGVGTGNFVDRVIGGDGSSSGRTIGRNRWRNMRRGLRIF